MPTKYLSARRVLLLFCVLFCAVSAVFPAACAHDVRSAIEQNQNTERYIDVPGRGMTYFYPQKNPIYSQMTYECKGSSTYRSFGEGGCAPAAASSALMALLDEDALTVLQQHTANGQPFSLCTHSLNAWTCRSCKERMPITSAADHRTYLPVILGSYACGNNPEGNIWRRAARSAGGSGGTSAEFLLKICPILGLSCSEVDDLSDASWLDRIGSDTVAVILSVSSPFTGSGHYVTVVSADEESIYLLDPLSMDSYSRSNDPLRCLEIIEPGLVRVSRSMYKHLGLYRVYLVSSGEQM